MEYGPPAWITIVIISILQLTHGADIVIQIPSQPSTTDRGDGPTAAAASEGGGLYRLLYRPPVGYPPTNFTFRPAEVGNQIEITDALPGTEYVFWLYYSNATFPETAMWQANILTVPDPPSNLSVGQRTGKSIQVNWGPPLVGGHNGFLLKVLPILDVNTTPRTFNLDADPTTYNIKDLTPGATYELRLFTMFDSKESAIYISTNVTTRPNNPGRFIVWFRNETTLLVLWQPPYPAGIFNHYRVSIEPPDAQESVLFVEKEGEPPGPAQAAFNGLVPGKAYNISVQTASEDQVSVPTTAQYRTVPLPPRNVTVNKRTLTSSSFQVQWEPPTASSEFDRYQVSLGIRRMAPIFVTRFEERIASFNEDLEPGKTYEVVVKTVSGNVFSWPTTANATTKPLPVSSLNATSNEMGEILLVWSVHNTSHQDFFKVVYQEMDAFNGDGDVLTISGTSYRLRKLFAGRNYSLAVSAVSNNVESDPMMVYQVTRPAPPLILGLEPLAAGALNVTWRSDVTSLQDSFAVVYLRTDTGRRSEQRTSESRIVLHNLYAGATYNVKVYAISYGLWSDPHAQQQTVYPNPPRNLTIVHVSNSTLKLQWLPPENSLFSHYVVKYRNAHSSAWTKLDLVKSESVELRDLSPGTKYTITVYSVSNRLDSSEFVQVDQILRPTPLINITPVLDSQNITFEWTVPEGHVNHYTIVYYAHHKPESVLTKQVIANGTGGEKTEVIIGDLTPGELYHFKFLTSSFGMESEPLALDTRTIPVINSDVYVVNKPQETRSLTLRYTPTPRTATIFDKYRFQLSDPAVPVQEKAQNDNQRSLVFTDLVPGRLYNVTVWTVSGGITSMPIHRQDRLYPEPITDINATSISDTDISLQWMPPPGDHDAYEVQYLNSENRLIQNMTRAETITYTNLQPHKNYTFTVIVRSGSETALMKRSVPFSKIFTTQESVPGKVRIFKAMEVKPSEITLTWSIPRTEQNGILTGYTVTYGLKDSAFTQSRDFSAKETSGTIYNLVAGKTYVFKIQAKTKVGYGSVSSFEELIPIWPPPVPSPQIFPTELSRTARTIQVRFRKNYFSNINGPITSYAIIVAEDHEKDSSGLELPAWQDVQDYKIWPPYQANEPYYPFNNTSMEDFVIGKDNCEGKTGYCNGPLKPGATYKVKIRAFTSRDKFSDTVMSAPIQTDMDSSAASALIAGILVPILLLGLVAMFIIYMHHQRLGPFMKKANKSGLRGKDDDLSIPESIIETSRPVKLKDFAEHFRIMSADSDFRFSEEYEELKHIGRDQLCAAADLPPNRPKNRFTNILPYDHSRVKLLPTDDEEGSDYINANYMPGYNSPREFIVTQGPLHSTRDDFWRMVWEQSCRAVVMLTRCVEKGREKCDRYWPYDTQPTYYGDIQVILLNESQYPDWTISEFKVSRGEISRVVKHFHFITWPDFGVPDPPQTLIRFVRTFRERVSLEQQRPIIVHCSAGVGRSGTFIALDRILQHIQKYDHVDIFGIVYEMRKERVWMVQTEQQYICIHQCLLCVLEGKENDNILLGEVHDNEGFEDDEGIAESGM